MKKVFKVFGLQEHSLMDQWDSMDYNTHLLHEWSSEEFFSIEEAEQWLEQAYGLDINRNEVAVILPIYKKS